MGISLLLYNLYYMTQSNYDIRKVLRLVVPITGAYQNHIRSFKTIYVQISLAKIIKLFCYKSGQRKLLKNNECVTMRFSKCGTRLAVIPGLLNISLLLCRSVKFIYFNNPFLFGSINC